MIGPTDLLIVSQDSAFERVCAELGVDSIAATMAFSYDAAAATLQQHPQCVCAVDGTLPMELVRRVCQLAKRSTGRPVVVLTDRDKFGGLSHHGYPAGVDICPVGNNLAETVIRLKAVMIVAGHDVRIMGNRPSVDSSSPDARRPSGGSVIAVFSPKGGVGKTTIAVNLAVGLAQIHSRRPLLVDGNFYFGDIAVLTNVAPRHTVSDLWGQPEFDALTLKALVTEGPLGVSILGSPPDITAVDGLDPETFVRAVTEYRTMFDYVIVDTRSSLDESMLQILDAADRILLVITPEVSVLYQAARLFAIADALHYEKKIMLVLNRAGSGLTLNSVEKNLGRRVRASIVSGGSSVTSAANRGVSLLSDDPNRRRKITRDLVDLVDLVDLLGAPGQLAPQTRPLTAETTNKQQRTFALPARLLAAESAL